MTPFELLHQLQLKSRDLGPSRRELEERRYAASDQPPPDRESTSPESEEFRRAYQRCEQVCFPDPIPPTQSLFEYAELKIIKRDLDVGISATQNFLPIANLVIGTNPSLDLNAAVAKVGDGFLAVVNSGLLMAIDQLATHIAVISDFRHPTFPRKVNKDRLQAAKPSFIRTILECFLYTASEHASVTLEGANSDQVAFSAIARYSAKRFILGHEYGHVVMRHLGADALKRMRIINEDFVVEMGSWRYWSSNVGEISDEFDADALSFFLSVISEQKTLRFTSGEFLSSVTIAWIGAILVFEILSMYDMIFGKWHRELMPRDGHPPPTDREGLLMQWIRERAPPQFLENLIDVRFGIRNATRALWRVCEDDLKAVVESNSEKIKELRNRNPHGTSSFHED